MITGASGGRGGSAARLFAERGAEVVLMARRADRPYHPAGPYTTGAVVPVDGGCRTV
ncbi:hypothetical protein ACFY2V_28330 [Streptomyces eurythermus]|uniref:hypothetical protein n=1 Tax=Streptomyces eurythermus TaxID=42237 RepID=UPI00367BCD58